MDTIVGINRRTVLAAGVALVVPSTAVIGATSAEAAPGTASALTIALTRYRKTRVGTFGLALRDRRDGASFTYNGFRNQTLSTIKVLVLVSLLQRSRERGVALNASQQSLAGRMIRNSDNAATDALIGQVGIAYIRATAERIGMTQTVVQGGSYGPNWWGYSTSVPGDLLRLVTVVAFGASWLAPADRNYVLALMSTVSASQRWGVSDPPLPTSLYTAVKNGWGPLSGGYRLNSIGYVRGSGREYTMAIVSRSPNGFSYGQTTVNAVSRLVYNALAKPLT